MTLSKNQRRENLSANRPKLSPKVENLFPTHHSSRVFFVGLLGSVLDTKTNRCFLFICCFTSKTNNGCHPFHLTVEAMRFMNGLSRGFDVGRCWGSSGILQDLIPLQRKNFFALPKKQKKIWKILFYWSLLKEVFLNICWSHWGSSPDN